jgi:phosphate/phosphite/phosphonate ABC transporter binding protein
MILASRWVAAALAFAALAGPAGLRPASAQDKPALVFTAIPDQDESRLVERFTKLAELLQTKLGVPVKYIPVKSYPAAVTAFTNNQVQLAWFGGFTGVQARRAVPGSQAIVQGAEDVNFKSFFIANAKTGLKPSKELPKEIAGKSFTFGARASTSGRLMPEHFLRQAFGRRPRRCSPASASPATTAARSSWCNPGPTRWARSTTRSGNGGEGGQGRRRRRSPSSGKARPTPTTSGRSAATSTRPMGRGSRTR